MFKTFDQQSVGTSSQLKSSVVRAIRSQLIEQFPKLEDVLEELFGKKSTIYTVNCKEQVQLLLDEQKNVLFFNQRDGHFLPSLKFASQYTQHFDCITVDKGAIRFVLSGSDVMDRGITSEGGHIPQEVEEKCTKGDVVVLLAEGKENPLSVGMLLKPPKEIKTQNSGKGVQNVHYLNDFLWNYKA